MKNLKFWILLALTITFFTCNNKHEGEKKSTILSNILSITDNENKGVKEILDFYGGECEYSIGYSVSTDDSKKKYFELEMSKSKLIEDKLNIPQLPASNIAYLFFKNLDLNERKNYEEIHTVLIFKDGKESNFEFPTKQLELVDEKLKIVNKVVGLIKQKNFDDLSKILNDTSLVSYNKKELLTNLKLIDPQFGNITKGFIPFGYKIIKTKNGREILHISGAIIRDKQSNAFSVDLSTNRNDDKIYFFQYEL